MSTLGALAVWVASFATLDATANAVAVDPTLAASLKGLGTGSHGAMAVTLAKGATIIKGG